MVAPFSGDDTVQITEGETLTKLISLASAPVDAEIVTVTYTPSAGAPFTISPTTPMMFTELKLAKYPTSGHKPH